MSYKNEQQDAIQSAYFGNQCFSIFTACCYFNVQGKIKKDNVIVVTEKSDLDRVASMSCLQKVVHEIEINHSKCYENWYVWSDGMGTQFRSCFVFEILASTILLNKSLMWLYNERHYGKGPMDGVRGTVKNVVFRKAKSGQVVIFLPQEFSEAVKTFAPAILAVYLSESENIINLKESKAQEGSRKPLKYTNWNERTIQMVTRTSIFTRLPVMRSLFMYNGM